MLDLTKFKGFDWDRGNIDKNKLKHRVEKDECEQVFFNKPLVIFPNPKHSIIEKRYGALGRTDKGRELAIFFTLRNDKVRVISARNQSKKDRKYYQKIKEGTKNE